MTFGQRGDFDSLASCGAHCIDPRVSGPAPASPRIIPLMPERTLSPDTTPEAEAVQIELLRRMTPAERFALVLRLNAQARALQMAGIRSRHPDASEEELRLRLASLWLDRETMIRMFGWDPDVEGLG